MNRHTLAVATLAAALPVLAAQEERRTPPVETGKPAAQQSPKTKEHDALRAFAGNWDVTYKLTEPGAAEPKESTGSESAELICDGLWLKSTMRGEFEDKPFTGLWLLGYDPYAKTYRAVCVDNHEPAAVKSDARYDEKTKTWEFSGTSSKGTFKTKAVFEGPDTIVETGTCTADGKESKLEITRKRTRMAKPMEASGNGDKAPSKEHAELLRTVGEWEAVMKTAPAPGAAPTETKGREVVVPICDRRWIWTDFTMQWEGKPFEGHALVGYDPAKMKYVSFWFDSMSPTAMESAGTYDAATKSHTMTGTGRDKDGKLVATRDVTTWKDDDTRHMKMEMKGAQTESFEITYKRKE